jgi:hypothetical protein
MKRIPYDGFIISQSSIIRKRLIPLTKVSIDIKQRLRAALIRFLLFLELQQMTQFFLFGFQVVFVLFVVVQLDRDSFDDVDPVT